MNKDGQYMTLIFYFILFHNRNVFNSYEGIQLSRSHLRGGWGGGPSNKNVCELGGGGMRGSCQCEKLHIIFFI